MIMLSNIEIKSNQELASSGQCTISVVFPPPISLPTSSFFGDFDLVLALSGVLFALVIRSEEV